MNTALSSQNHEMVDSSRSENVRIMISAGEASSDEHAAALVEAIQEQNPQARFFGMGGSALRALGVDTIVDSESTAGVMGLTEVVGSIPKLLRAKNRLVEQARIEKPQALILVDFPDFNMLLARSVSKLGVNVVYYISPQLWAWRQGQIRTIKKHFKKIFTIFPFEAGFYEKHGVKAEYVGHPFLDRPELQINRESYLVQHKLDPSRPVIALLPGSRSAEVERLFQPMLEAFDRLQKGRPGLQAMVPVASSLSADVLHRMAEGRENIVFVEGEAREILSVADVAVVASGTATVEAAVCGVPFVVVYKLSELTWRIGRLLIKGVKNVAMPNLIAGEPVVKELLQHDVTPGNIAAEVESILGDSDYAQVMVGKLKSVKEKLKLSDSEFPTATARAAHSIMEMIAENEQPKRSL